MTEKSITEYRFFKYVGKGSDKYPFSVCDAEAKPKTIARFKSALDADLFLSVLHDKYQAERLNQLAHDLAVTEACYNKASNERAKAEAERDQAIVARGVSDSNCRAADKEIKRLEAVLEAEREHIQSLERQSRNFSEAVSYATKPPAL